MPLNLTLDIAQYRNALPLRQVMNALGLSVNGDSMILCPAHGEKHPSCKIYPDHVHCFSCGFHEDSIGLVQQVLKCDFWGSLEWIADRGGIARPKRDPASQKQYEAVKSISETYANVFHDALKNPEPALIYLEKKRGISRATAEGRVGYLPPRYRPPDVEGAKLAGLYSKAGNFLFTGRLVIPILRHGQIVSLYGRALDPERKPAHIYPETTDPPAPATLWNLDACAAKKQIFLAEGIIDALTLMDRGFANTAAVFGTQGLTDARLEALKRTQIEKIVLCFDSDTNESGQKAALKTGEKLFRSGYEVEIVTLPLDNERKKTDLNSYLKDHSADDFRELPRRDFFDCILDTVPTEGSPQERYKALSPIFELVAGQPELTWKEYISAIRKRFPGYDRRLLEKEVVQTKAIKDIPSQDSNGLPVGKLFRPLPYVKRILADHHVIAFAGEFYCWTPEAGYYQVWRPETVTNVLIGWVDDEIRAAHVREVKEVLFDLTVKKPEEVNPINLLCLKKNILDYETGELLPHTPDIYLMSQFPVSFDPDAKSPRYDDFLSKALPESLDRNLWHEICAYTLIRDARYQVGFLLMDDDIGNTGKSTLGEILQRMLGAGNCSTVRLAEFGAKFKIAELAGKHANISTEINVKDFLDDSIVKQLISGEPFQVERKYERPFDFRNFAKIIVTANRFPNSYDSGDAFHRRWIVLEFFHKFPMQGQPGNIPKFGQTLSTAELDGVFLKVILGLKRLRDNDGFTIPPSTEALNERFRRHTNPVADFAYQCLKIGDSQIGASLRDLHAEYVSWYEDMIGGQRFLRKRSFKKSLQSVTGKSFIKDTSTKERILPGVPIRAEWERIDS